MNSQRRGLTMEGWAEVVEEEEEEEGEEGDQVPCLL